MALFLTVAMLIAVLSTSTVVAWEPLDSPAPPDGKLLVFDNFDTNIELSRWSRSGQLGDVFAYTSQDAWYEPRPYDATSGYWWSVARSSNPVGHVSLTYRAFSTHYGGGFTWQGDWAIGQVTFRGGTNNWAFGIAFYPWEGNTKAHCVIAKDTGAGYYSLHWDLPFNVLDFGGCGGWHYYRIICGYDYWTGWDSYVWFYVGNDNGHWTYLGGHDCTTDSMMRFSKRGYGAGITDYPFELCFGWHNYIGAQVTSPWIGLDFVAWKWTGDAPWP